MINSEDTNLKATQSIRTSIAPWLSVQNGAEAVEFYKAAFGAIETYHLETPDGGIVVKLSVDGAEFWVSGGTSEAGALTKELPGGETVRIILTVANPEPVFAQALKAGAT